MKNLESGLFEPFASKEDSFEWDSLHLQSRLCLAFLYFQIKSSKSNQSSTENNKIKKTVIIIR